MEAPKTEVTVSIPTGDWLLVGTVVVVADAGPKAATIWDGTS